MKQRIITAIVALAIFIPIILMGGWLIELAAVALALVAMAEIFIMKKQIIISVEALIAFIGVAALVLPNLATGLLPAYLTPSVAFYGLVLLLLLCTVFFHKSFNFDDAGVYTLAMLYIGFGFHYFVVARHDGLAVLFYALLIVWCTDTGAYFVGKYFGKHKLAKYVSPNKTWEGSVGGVVIATVVCSIYVTFFPVSPAGLIPMIGLTVILSVAGQLGDLVESALKRYYGVKDSGKILPGHGGILDRFDSLLFVLPVLHLLGIV
ncbi:phosphatidate cytidylyltransferase [Fructilactobacillus myrtifloralis]|uniref:Phosphatidate cytidylyltransferase n=1 Tax=Fructilactobacillus myrtifloralis TaxID=2940301 RepID=A0ABY5BQW0_9LACO|nr:phosphatidate cytidylyltransferase [Fructilactobacillus myrtifloralis]USS85432.1 phosphatidate cytidylyltransferase [Fructilactobacillus myrtifloralis]